MVMVSASHVGVSLGARPVLTDVTLDVLPGEVLVIVGPNGAGKSTLLRAFSGELPVASGSVCLGGSPLDQMSEHDLARKRALMPQHASLSFPFKVKDVVSMGREPFRSDGMPELDAVAIQWALAATDTDGFLHRPYTRLSGGEQQRVQLARVLAQTWRPADKPEDRFLFLDEPTSSLDLSHQHATLHLAGELAKQGVGVVAVVHDLNLAAIYADRVAVISGGCLAALGPPSDVLMPDVIQTVFGLTVRRIHDGDTGRHLILPTGHHASMSKAIGIAAQ
ncbi:MAG: heme ABC transporter ATP-binding protein [Pseudomonadota bacterium]